VEESTKRKQSTWYRIGVIALIVVVIAGIFIYKIYSSSNKNPQSVSLTANNAKLPKLVDLGAGTCIPCKQMAPILEELKKEYEGRVIVEVIDVNENPKEAEKYKIRVIPTQILIDADGKEVGRHEGFIPKEDLIKAFEQVVVK
jgi:thioredoxin 1